MSVDEILGQAIDHGNQIGQVALAEFILKSYGHELSPTLKSFLQKVTDKGYSDIGRTVGKPAEDIALGVNNIIQEVG